MLRRLKPNKLWVENMILAAALPWVAGAVNAAGFFAVGAYTSHVSGHLARVGDELAQGHASAAWASAVFVCIFLVGAVTATALVENAKRKAKARYVAALFLEAAVLTAFTVFSSGMFPRAGVGGMVLTGMLSFSMGLQNALVTRMSGAVVRTTHMTGVTTDIGIELVRAFLWMRDKVRAEGLRSFGTMVRLFPHDPELKRLRLHALILGSFVSGAVTGPTAYLAFGGTAMLFPVLVLLGLVAFDATYGLGSGHSQSTERPSGEHHALHRTPAPGVPDRLAAPYDGATFPVYPPKDRDPKA